MSSAAMPQVPGLRFGDLMDDAARAFLGVAAYQSTDEHKKPHIHAGILHNIENQRLPLPIALGEVALAFGLNAAVLESRVLQVISTQPQTVKTIIDLCEG